MVRKCGVEGCLSDSNRPEDVGVTFHKVPMHPDIRPKWLSLCRISEEKKGCKVIYVCSRHFLRADFCNFKGKKYMLKQGVLPSVFPWDKSKLEALKAEIKKETMTEPVVKTEPDVSQSITDKIKEEVIEPKKEVEELVEPKQEIPESAESKEESFPEMFLTNVSGTEAATIEPVEQSTQSGSGSINFVIDSEIEALDFNNTWYPARIAEIDYEENEVLIHFETYSAKYDEWICMDSPRLRPLQGTSSQVSQKIDEKVPIKEAEKRSSIKKIQAPIEKYVVGERCLASWSNARKFSATVTKVLANDTYEVLFDDGFVKNLKAHRMLKTEGRRLQSSPLFDPIQSTKQERRDKKRKLNVAALFRKRPKLANEGGDDKQQSQESPTHLKPVPPQLKDATPIQGKTQPKAKRQSRGGRKSEGKALPKASAAVLDESQTEQTGLPKETSSVPSESEQPVDKDKWFPKWSNGLPVGTESSIETHDGTRKSYIVPDPRLPDGWAKHLVQRPYGASAGKWDTVIVGPDGRRFRAKSEIRSYLEANPSLGLNESMFDFSLHRQRTRKHPLLPLEPEKQKPAVELPVSETIPIASGATDQAQEEQLNDTIESDVDKDAPNLKILHVDDAYKCPIQGCGKNFRKENLAQMHVKHYHPEYTKFLDSTPNVADLAYARTVGDSLDRSPGPAKTPPASRSAQRTPAPKASTSKTPSSPLVESDIKPLSPQPQQTKPTKDAEIIKLLNSKPVDSVKEVEGGRQPSPVPSLSQHMETKLRDLLNKSDSGPKIEDKLPKALVNARPTGIKTLLPVRPAEPDQIQEPPEPLKKSHSSKSSSKHGIKRKRHPDIADPSREKEHKKETAEILEPPPVQQPPPQEPPPPEPPTHIIEGGKLIKIVRMKQEEIINCTCGYAEEDGLMIQCELCLCWQHAYCNNIEQESQVPEKYICYICQNPPRQRPSRKYYHDQDWLKQGVLPMTSYHAKDEEAVQKRFEKLKKAHDISGGLVELKEYVHSLRVKLKIAEAKNHPKLYLWSKPWEKLPLPEKMDAEEEKKTEDTVNPDQRQIKNEVEGKDVMDTSSQQNDSQNESMLMMILKGGKEDNKLDLNSLMDSNQSQAPLIPQPEAAIDSAVCRVNLLDHISHAQNLVDERLDDFEKKIEALEEGLSIEESEDYPKTRQTLQMLLRDLNTVREFSSLSSI